MKRNLQLALVCLLLAVVFGGVGVVTSWILATSIYDGVRAKDWVRVKATVVSHSPGNVGYAYTFAGRNYTGDRMGPSVMSNSEDEAQDLNAKLAAAHSERKPVTVFVNPDNPSESMADREIHWGSMLFLVPFAFGFGGVGLGALWALTRVLQGKKAKAKPASPQAEARGGGVVVAPATPADPKFETIEKLLTNR